jgi:hypothetical protein
MRLAILVLALAGCHTTYDFQPIDVGTRSAKVPREKSNDQYLRASYADLVSRAPESYMFEVDDANGQQQYTFPVDEQQTLQTAADSVGDPAPLRALIVTGLVSGAESQLPDKSAVDPSQFIRGQFQRLLGRDPSPYELAAFVASWSDPSVGPRTIVRAIVGSREYQSY